jgi:pimeloyl-ACP methyl ester carboxylesterase
MVVETGEGVPSSSLDPIRSAYDSQMMVCGYDRANTGASGSAPTPRQRDDVIADLHGLLQAAEIPGPVVLVGHSAGGLIVQAYAVEHPDEVVGVVAMNAVPSWREWSTLGFDAMTPTEQKAETAYYEGDNGESLDYKDISAGTEGPGPALPLHVLISTIAQCESKTDVCGRTYPAYTRIMKSLAKRWPDGQFSQVNAPHEIYTEDMQAVTTAIDDVLKRSQ